MYFYSYINTINNMTKQNHTFHFANLQPLNKMRNYGQSKNKHNRGVDIQ